MFTADELYAIQCALNHAARKYQECAEIMATCTEKGPYAALANNFRDQYVEARRLADKCDDLAAAPNLFEEALNMLETAQIAVHQLAHCEARLPQHPDHITTPAQWSESANQHAERIEAFLKRAGRSYPTHEEVG